MKNDEKLGEEYSIAVYSARKISNVTFAVLGLTVYEPSPSRWPEKPYGKWHKIYFVTSALARVGLLTSWECTKSWKKTKQSPYRAISK